MWRVVSALLLASAATLAVADIPDVPSESKVKAAFLFKFTSYVDWPTSAFEQTSAPLVISVVNDEDIAGQLTRLVSGRMVNNHSIVVRRLSSDDSSAGSHVLFIGSAASNRLGRILDGARSQPVLTVTELDDALSFASVINFVVIDDQVRFDVSLPAAERNNLKISSRLLTVARQVLMVAP